MNTTDIGKDASDMAREMVEATQKKYRNKSDGAFVAALLMAADWLFDLALKHDQVFICENMIEATKILTKGWEETLEEKKGMN